VVRADGRVVAINSSIPPEFGGSNLGVPADLAAELLREVDATSTGQRSRRYAKTGSSDSGGPVTPGLD